MPSSLSLNPVAEPARRSERWDATRSALRLLDCVGRAAQLCRALPNEDSSNERFANRRGLSSPSRAQRKIAPQPHGQWLRSGRSRVPGLIELPFRKGFRRPVPDFRSSRSRRRSMPRDSQNSQGNSPPTQRSVCSGCRVLPDIGLSPRMMQSRSVLPGQVHYRKGIQPAQNVLGQPAAAAQPLMPHEVRNGSRRCRSTLAVCGSNTSIGRIPSADWLSSSARTGSRQTLDR